MKDAYCFSDVKHSWERGAVIDKEVKITEKNQESNPEK